MVAFPVVSLPTDYHPGVTSERLKVLAAVLVRVRQEAIAAHEFFSGERNASLGLRTFERASKAFRDLAGEVDWLEVHEEDGACILIIDRVFAFKFHRGDPERPNARTRIENTPEAHAKQRAFGFMATLPMRPREEVLGSTWRLYYMDDPDTREVISVSLARLDAMGNTIAFWPINFSEPVRAVAPVVSALPEPADLEEPVVVARSIASERAAETVRTEDEGAADSSEASNDVDT